jgi:hypothetical protein
MQLSGHKSGNRAFRGWSGHQQLVQEQLTQDGQRPERFPLRRIVGCELHTVRDAINVIRDAINVLLMDVTRSPVAQFSAPGSVDGTP